MWSVSDFSLNREYLGDAVFRPSANFNNYLKSGKLEGGVFHEKKSNVFASYIFVDNFLHKSLQEKKEFTCDAIGLLHKGRWQIVDILELVHSTYGSVFDGETSVYSVFDPKKLNYNHPSSFVVKNKTKKLKDYKNLLLINADFDEEAQYVNNLIVYTEFQKFPVISFNCLARIIGPKVDLNESEIVEVLNKLNLNLLNVIDFTPAQKHNLTSQEKKLRKKGKYVLPAGFSFLHHDSIHCSGSVLVEYKGNHYLFGQDEGTYFGVQLPKAVKTLAQAYNSLIPSKVLGKNYIRQGEWFVVPLEEVGLKLPETKNCVTYVDGCYISSDMNVALPREINGNAHIIRFHSKKGAYRIDCKNRIYVKNFELSHEEHKSVIQTNDKWYTFYKNTALKSVSQKGVD